jgi:dihydrolipoamide dehydrogenase
VIFDADTDELLGAHILGAEASDLIAEVGIARTLETTHYEVLKTVHAHPTLSEAIMEAVGNAYGEPFTSEGLCLQVLWNTSGPW